MNRLLKTRVSSTFVFHAFSADNVFNSLQIIHSCQKVNQVWSIMDQLSRQMQTDVNKSVFRAAVWAPWVIENCDVDMWWNEVYNPFRPQQIHFLVHIQRLWSSSYSQNSSRPSQRMEYAVFWPFIFVIVCDLTKASRRLCCTPSISSRNFYPSSARYWLTVTWAMRKQFSSFTFHTQLAMSAHSLEHYLSQHSKLLCQVRDNNEKIYSNESVCLFLAFSYTHHSFWSRLVTAACVHASQHWEVINSSCPSRSDC